MDVTIGSNAVIGGHSVVNRDVAAGTVVAGLPAKLVADRVVGGPAMDFFTAEEADAYLARTTGK